MRRFVVKKEQLNEYIENKKAEKTFYDILEILYLNSKMLDENISHKNVNQSVINDFRRKSLITPKVYKMLIECKIINDDYNLL